MICPALAASSTSAMSGKTGSEVERYEEEVNLYETDYGDEPEKSESESSEDGDSQGENGNDVTQEKDQGTPNPAKEKPQEQENLRSGHNSKSVVCLSSEVTRGEKWKPGLSRKTDDRSPEMGSESKKQRKKKHKKKCMSPSWLLINLRSNSKL